MKSCPNCKYLWPDEHIGQCVECGNPMASVASNGSQDLSFRYASQLEKGRREAALEQSFTASSGKARVGDAYDRAPVESAVVERARAMLVQREELKYEEAE